jgi:hypothetical protein
MHSYWQLQESIHIIRHNTTRNDTTREKPVCIHIYWRLTDMIVDNLFPCLIIKQSVFESTLFFTVLFDLKCMNNFNLRIWPV